jgi:hypothetical protein
MPLWKNASQTGRDNNEAGIDQDRTIVSALRFYTDHKDEASAEEKSLNGYLS